jgi:hypothetical protein
MRLSVPAIRILNEGNILYSYSVGSYSVLEGFCLLVSAYYTMREYLMIQEVMSSYSVEDSA